MKITKLLFFIVAGIILSFQTKAHPFYVSVCQIDYNIENKSLDISLKLFTDDLITGLEDKGDSGLRLGESDESPKTDQVIISYLHDSFIISVDGEKRNCNFIGKEMIDDVVWCYFEIINVENFNKIEVTNSILTDVFESQSNIIHVKKDGTVRSLLLGSKKSSGLLMFN